MILKMINNNISGTYKQSTLVKSISISLVGMENFILIMVIFYRVNSKMEDAKVKDAGLKLMAVIMKEILKIMLPMDMEGILMSMATNMKGNGKIIFPMERDKPNILMEVVITDSF